MLSGLFSWLTWDPFADPAPVAPATPPSLSLKVVRIPADGSAPHLIQLNTVEVRSEGNMSVDSFLWHIPDFRPFWSSPNGWKRRDMVSVCAAMQHPPQLNGIYYGFKSFDIYGMPTSEHTGFNGDAFIVKLTETEYGLHGWPTYEDVPEAFLSSLLLGMVLERLRNV